MVEIENRLALSYGGGQLLAIPPSLVVEEQGQRFLKLQLSHPVLVKLFCGQKVELLGGLKNPSLVGSAKLQQLKTAAIQAAVDSVNKKKRKRAGTWQRSWRRLC